MKSKEATELRPGRELSTRVAQLLGLHESGLYSEVLEDSMSVIFRIADLGKTLVCTFPGGEDRERSDENVFWITLGPFFHEDQETPYTYMRATNDLHSISLTVCQLVMEAEAELKELVDDFVE